jgi:2-keto-4-pentenoate hydratase
VLTDVERRAAAAALAGAERTRQPIDQLTVSYPAIDVEDAYEIQLLQIRDKLAAGRRVRGHKVGLSSKAMQRMMGVHEPDYGHLLDDMFVFEHGEICRRELLVPRVEVEVAFALSEPLPAPGCTAADVMRCTAFVCPALEIIDSRIRDWRIALCDTIADNASSARVVLGAAATDINDIDLRTIGAVLRIDGDIVATGASGAVLGNPVTAVAWLANKVHAYGVILDAGHVVLPGSCTKAFDVAAGQTVRADFDRLGHVSVSFG